MMTQLVPVHVGLVGHIDHGKTELARALSEKVSTAGLDKHPQAKERGITIDLGFTMFTLGKMRVTLVDAPGHADLIRSVVAGANIIDAAILVVAADEGPKIQTGEHIVVLRSLGIDTIVVAITKSDLVEPKALKAVQEKVRTVLQEAAFKDTAYVAVSAKNGEGIDQLKEVLNQKIRPKKRLTDGSFLMPIDHAFPVKGHGTVVTGTIQRGILRAGDTVRLMPQDAEARVRTIQTFGENLPEAKAGDRVGVNIPDMKYSEISRGDYLSEQGALVSRKGVLVQLERNRLYKGRITDRMVVSTMVGMPNVTAEIVPFTEDRRVIMDEAKETGFMAALLFQNQIAVEEGQKVILQAYAVDPLNPTLLFNLATNNAFRGNMEAANRYASELAEVKPDWDGTYRLKSQIANAEGRMDQQLRWSLEALRRDPESVGTMLYRNTYHYWFHTGEAHAIRQMLGHGELPQLVGNMSAALYRPEVAGS